VRNATRILVFENSRIVESGTFDELVAKGGAFAELAKAQFLTGSPQDGPAQANAGEAASAAE
jgi:ATP-binding cassette subfamily B protein